MLLFHRNWLQVCGTEERGGLGIECIFYAYNSYKSGIFADIFVPDIVIGKSGFDQLRLFFVLPSALSTFLPAL